MANKSFSFSKALWKFALGAAGTLVAMLQANPAILTDSLPAALLAMGVGGFVVEILDYIAHIIGKNK